MSILSSSIIFFVWFGWNQALTFPQDEALALAQKLENSGFYHEAITEYKRYLFFTDQNLNPDISPIYLNIALAYRAEKEWDLAVEFLEKSIEGAATERDRDDRRIILAATQLAQNKISLAKFSFIKIEMFSPFPDLKRQATFFHSLCALYEYNWGETEEVFTTYFKNDTSNCLNVRKEEMDAILQEATSLKYKSPKLAKWLSTFLPGLGQIYSGSAGKGLNSLALNAATASLLVNDLLARQYQDVFFNSFFLFLRFYRGNRRIAEQEAIAHNEALNRKYLQKMLLLLE